MSDSCAAGWLRGDGCRAAVWRNRESRSRAADGQKKGKRTKRKKGIRWRFSLSQRCPFALPECRVCLYQGILVFVLRCLYIGCIWCRWCRLGICCVTLCAIKKTVILHYNSKIVTNVAGLCFRCSLLPYPVSLFRFCRDSCSVPINILLSSLPI